MLVAVVVVDAVECQARMRLRRGDGALVRWSRKRQHGKLGAVEVPRGDTGKEVIEHHANLNIELLGLDVCNVADVRCGGVEANALLA